MATKSAQERTRLVDHFKRAYQIIVGLSITLACTKLFPAFTLSIDMSFWLFCIFFITVVPVFQGGDRSLDIKYLERRPKGFLGHFAYVWDVFMLLITAILFVKIAQTIPVADASKANTGLIGLPSPATPESFYRWMAIMLFVDVAILIIDWIKSNYLKIESAAKLSSYLLWIIMNSVLGAVCLAASDPCPFIASISPAWLSFGIFGLALTRTFLDYVFGAEFMFP